MVPAKTKIGLLKLTAGCVIMLMMFFASCTNQKQDNAEKESVKTENSDATERAREELEQDLNEALKKADDKLALLEDQLADASQEAKNQIEKAIEEIKKERQKIAEKVEDVADASEKRWKDVKEEAEESIKNADLKIDSLVRSI